MHHNQNDKPLIIDGLIISKWGRPVFEDMRKGQLTAANCTCCVWENFQQTINNLTQWNHWFLNNSDLIRQVFTTDDIKLAKKENKTGIILGFQNVSAIEDQIDYLAIFKRLGIGIIQLAYNTQNLVGSGCYESNDSGLSDFGHDVIDEMNRLGIAIDLSHVGSKTAKEAILHSKQRVTYSHCLPNGLKKHLRNKSDDELKFIARHQGFVGVTMFTPFLQKGINSTVKDYVEAIDYVCQIIGEESVGIGTDFTQGYDRQFFDWITHDKGYGRKLTEFGEIINPKGIETIEKYPNLIAAMQQAKWPETKIKRIVGENWLNYLDDVWA